MAYLFGEFNSCSGATPECESGYSLYFPCIKNITRGENTCTEFYIVDNATKEEVDLRDVDAITLNMSGRYNCNFGSYSYPENIKSLQEEDFSEVIYNIDFSDIVNRVKLYIDIVDENHLLIESHEFSNNLILDIDIVGHIGYFLKKSNKYGVLNLNAFDTHDYMFLGWDIDENDVICNLENIYDYLITDKNLIYSVEEDLTVRAVYQKRREFSVKLANDNHNSSFEVEYYNGKECEKYTLSETSNTKEIKVLEGHKIKVSCIPYEVKPYKFVKWDDELIVDNRLNPYTILTIPSNITGDTSGEDTTVSLKAYCSLKVDDYIEFVDNIDASSLNNFNNRYPEIKTNMFIDYYFTGEVYIINCEIDVLNDDPYIKIIEDGYLQFINIGKTGNLKFSLNNIGGDCKLFVDGFEVLPSTVDKNEFAFEFNGDVITITGDSSCVFSIIVGEEVIYNKGKCMFCLTSEDTLKLHQGELYVDGGVIVNGEAYGLASVHFANVTDITPLVVKY